MNPFSDRPCPNCGQRLSESCDHVDTVAICPICDATIELRECPKTGRGIELVTIGLRDITAVDEQIRAAVQRVLRGLRH